MATWLSGASGDGAANGAFGTWRGTPLGIGGTWNDSADAQINQWSIQPTLEWGSWTGPLDLAFGAIYKTSGETWANAASGAYDARWITGLKAIKKYWGARSLSNLYIRFAHEFNGSWTPWNVLGTEVANFKLAWIRFRALQLSLLPGSHLVFCPNDGTSSSLGLDWRKAFPGANYIDVMAVDSYNQYPWVNTAVDFNSKINATGSYGEPLGIEKHRQYALVVGLPFAVSEWASNADMGDAPVFIDQMQKWFIANAGTGPGKLIYEVLFNISSFGDGQFVLNPKTKSPLAAAQYAADF